LASIELFVWHINKMTVKVIFGFMRVSLIMRFTYSMILYAISLILTSVSTFNAGSGRFIW